MSWSLSVWYSRSPRLSQDVQSGFRFLVLHSIDQQTDREISPLQRWSICLVGLWSIVGDIHCMLNLNPAIKLPFRYRHESFRLAMVWQWKFGRRWLLVQSTNWEVRIKWCRRHHAVISSTWQLSSCESVVPSDPSESPNPSVWFHAALFSLTQRRAYWKFWKSSR